MLEAFVTMLGSLPESRFNRNRSFNANSVCSCARQRSPPIADGGVPHTWGADPSQAKVQGGAPTFEGSRDCIWGKSGREADGSGSINSINSVTGVVSSSSSSSTVLSVVLAFLARVMAPGAHEADLMCAGGEVR